MSSIYLTDEEIDNMRVIDLKEALSDRGLSQSGLRLKKEFAHRLKDYIRSQSQTYQEKKESRVNFFSEFQPIAFKIIFRGSKNPLSNWVS